MALTSSRPSTSAGPGQGEQPGPTGRSGWHADPWRRYQVRFFDGRLWTEHVADGGIASIDSGPVAGHPRSRPTSERLAPPTLVVGARVLDQPGASAPGPLDHPILLLDEATGAGQDRPLSTPDDVGVGRVRHGRPSLVARTGRRLVAAPTTTVTRITVVDGDEAERLALARPWARAAATVDVSAPDGPLGTVVAEAVRRGIRARILDPTGSEVGRLTQDPGPSAPLQVAQGDGVALARLAAVWDVPGARHHLPPGVVVIDRRPVLDGPRSDPRIAALVLGALLAPVLLAPPLPPADG